MRLRSRLALSCLLICATTVAAPSTYRALHTHHRVTLDAVLNERWWEKTPSTNGFLRTDGKPTEADTQVRVCYDKRNLYFGIVCQEPRVDRLLRAVTVENGPVWEDDSIELFIAPDVLYRDTYLHLVFNTLGTRFSAAKGTGPTGTMGWQVATRVAQRCWVAEVAVPFSMLGVTEARPVHVMAASVCRERWTGVKEFTHWPLGGSFHRPGAHLLFTSYDRFVREVLLSSWEQSLAPLRRTILADPTVRQQMLPDFRAVATPVDKALKIVQDDKQLTAADCERLIRSIKAAKAALPPVRHRASMLLLERLVNQ